MGDSEESDEGKHRRPDVETWFRRNPGWLNIGRRQHRQIYPCVILHMISVCICVLMNRITMILCICRAV